MKSDFSPILLNLSVIENSIFVDLIKGQFSLVLDVYLKMVFCYFHYKYNHTNIISY